jgi:hypothetical protein
MLLRSLERPSLRGPNTRDLGKSRDGKMAINGFFNARVLYNRPRCLPFLTMRTVVLSYARTRRPDVRTLVRLLGGFVVAEREETLAVRFAPEALASVFCRVLDKLRLPVLVTVVDESRQAMAQVSGG